MGTVACAILYNTAPKRLPIAGLLGVEAWVVYSTVKHFSHEEVFSVFVGAFIMAITSELLARLLKSPALVFSVSGAIPLIPGFSAYSTIKHIIDSEFINATFKCVNTIASAGSIAFGIMLAIALFRIFSCKIFKSQPKVK
jgi:uncharacterized membrane protein YjjB (DUF3815 family)